MLSAKLFETCRRTLPAALLGAVLLAPAGARDAAGDDRDLLRESTGEPYVFILLDTSGSMNWTPRCTQAQLDAGECAVLCENRDCFARLQADDPSSKLYQAKAALYEVLRQVDGVQFGFATYNQDDLSVRAKHWIYRPRGNGVTLPGNVVFPQPGSEEVFGFLWNCDTGQNDNEIGCSTAKPADLDDAWEITRMRRLPKGGTRFNQDVTFFIRHAGSVYRVRYRPVAGPQLGAPAIQVRVRVDRCTNGSCSASVNVGEPTVDFDSSVVDGRAEEFLSWENGDNNNTNRTSTPRDPTVNYFTSTAMDASAGDTCAGWDPNTDSGDDPGPDHRQNPRTNLRWPTDNSDARGPLFSFGDVIPLDWQTDHKEAILDRLSPNRIAGFATPDFRIAPYLRDLPDSGESFLRLEDSALRPLIASGSTPLGNSVAAFRTWYAGCPHGNCPNGSGWKHIAAAQDPDWGCRRKFLLVITDGDDTCGGSDPCSFTAGLRAQEGILTYVVAFGVENTTGNRLNCMAANGGTGDPIYPQNKQELVDALTEIFSQIREQASSFASAAVPTVQTEVADKIYISNFTPLNGEPFWDGHIDAYLKPLPLTADGLPDRGVACPAVGTPTRPRSACHLWDAGAELVEQAPRQADLDAAPALDASTLRLGLGESQRRVFYTRENSGSAVPSGLSLFAPPTGAPATDPDWLDLLRGFKLASSTPADRIDSAGTARDVIAKTLVVKTSAVQTGNGPGTPIDYVLGDTFHADPTIVDRPSDFDRYAANLHRDPGAANCSTDPGYVCWADQHKRRRKMLAVAANDGQLHVFDAGVWDASRQKFTDGTGRELFSYAPRLGLPILRELEANPKHVFSLDSTPRLDEVFIDPLHDHPGDPAAPRLDERQWRTVLVGGFREGGDPFGGSRMADFVSGYYALDVTQPDRLNSRGEPVDDRLVPSCLSIDNSVLGGCGPLPFPAVLWEFTDSLQGSRMDEDDNGYPDLGQTWSIPTVGRIQVKDAADNVIDKYVAIFGGGMDADAKSAPRSGNWLYIVDVETGKALYKRQLLGAAPSDPAVIDRDNDGVLDTIYIGTTAGRLYKVDMKTPARLVDVTLARTLAVPDLAADPTVQRVIDPAWNPFPIFSTGGKPIYFPPSVLFVSRLESHALAFGAGDRENLWDLSNQEGRFYLVLDEDFKASQVGAGQLPKTEADYAQVTPSSAPGSTDFVLTPDAGKNRGWFLRLEPNERVITPAFALAGLVVFSSYEPNVTATGPGNGNGNNGDPPVCGRTGVSRVYTIFANNANAVLRDPGSGLRPRFQEVPVFVAPPNVDSGATKNEPNPQNSAETLTPAQQEILEELKKFFPRGTRFGNFWYTVSAMGSDTRYVGIAAIPIGILESNWKKIQ